ncbi:uncharacterized protein N7511_007406 [Penicillium nucicola]|uniref:uncharacterized protein n=1 Tax=Penicillium nucicola TaxID=1850975 RepID=UPI002545B34F|nr:uncharacterized protein N7511_007406 [Penicillium nucicola]KAJ5757224.1 hypothetical protein N7511_007406 [Penicillium nucicola]
MSEEAKLKRPITKGPPVQVNSIQYWTLIVENDTASHLLSFYFTWENPTWNLIDQESFLQDLETHHPGRYCSHLLVYVLLFFGCSFSYRLNRITDRREEKDLGQKLYDQIQRLWEKDKGTPDLPTIQSGILLGLLSCTFGVDRLGTQFIMNGAKLYVQTGFDTVERCARSEKETELSSEELSQEMVSWAIFDVQAWVSPSCSMEITNLEKNCVAGLQESLSLAGTSTTTLLRRTGRQDRREYGMEALSIRLSGHPAKLLYNVAV